MPAQRRPRNGVGIISGKIVRPARPAAARIWAATEQARYPTRSAYRAAAQSTSSCRKKFRVTIVVISAREIP